jgi:hypothetical protein
LSGPYFHRDGLEAERLRGRVDLANFQRRGGSDIGQDRQAAETGDKLAQNFEPLGSKIGELERQAGDIAAWSGQTRDQAGADRVARGREHDRDD